MRPNGFKNISNMSQLVWNIIIDDQKHILNLIKSHKGHLKKRCSTPASKKIPISVLSKNNWSHTTHRSKDIWLTKNRFAFKKKQFGPSYLCTTVGDLIKWLKKVVLICQMKQKRFRLKFINNMFTQSFGVENAQNLKSELSRTRL